MGDFVDDYLQQARRLLGSGQSPSPATPPPATPNPPSPHIWAGDAADRAAHTSTALAGTRGQLADVRTHTDQIITSTAEIPCSGHQALNVIQAGWDSDKTSLAPCARTAEGRAALLRAGQSRIAETQTLITDVANRYDEAAAAVHAAKADLPDQPAPRPADTDEPANPDGQRKRPPRGTTPTNVAEDSPSADRRATPRPSGLIGRALATPTIPAAPAAGLFGSGGLSSTAGGGGSGLSSPLTALSGLTSPLTAPAGATSAPGEQPDMPLSGNLDPTSDRDDPGRRAALAALSRQGTPYVWGAKGPRFFDCSGLTQWAWQQAGINLDGDTYAQIREGVRVPPSAVRAGDLIFPLDSFGEGGRPGPGHVQLALGPNTVIHAPHTGDVVRVASMPSQFIAIRPVPH